MTTKIMLTFPMTPRPTAFVSRCQPDLLDPKIKCLAKETSDDRQCVSHFFGRNKISTATIPQEYFPMLCRKHYQERLYRWNDDPGAYAGYQCDNILKVLETMSEKVLIDENGNKWPWWCGFELRLVQTSDGKGAASSTPAPAWLVKMCHTKKGNIVEETRSVRYNLGQLTQIVKAIKSWCVSNGTSLPRVEALPLTIGICDVDALDRAKKVSRESDSKRDAAYIALNRSNDQDSMLIAQAGQVPLALQQLDEEAELAKDILDLATMDAASSRMTIPPKRETKARSAKTCNGVPNAYFSTKTESSTTSAKRPRELKSETETRKRIKCDGKKV